MIFFLSLFTTVCVAQNNNQTNNAKAVSKSTLDNWCFQYQYDSRRRMTHKKVPGADWVYIVYDDRDRIVMTQDGEQRKSNKWMFTRYDVLNRPVTTGVYTHNDTLGHAGMSAKISRDTFYETFDAAAMPFMYTDNMMTASVFPGSFEFLTVTYYDNYSFLAGDRYFEYKTERLAGQAPSPFTRVNGQTTGVWTKVLGNHEQWLRTVNYYDDKYRLIQSIRDNHKGGQDILTNVFDFVGHGTASKSEVIDHSVIQQIAADTDGWIEVTCTGASGDAFGFSRDASTAPVDFGLKRSGTSVRVIEAGVLKGPIVRLIAGDILRMERKGDTIHYRRNNILFYSTALRARPPLYTHTTAGLINVKTSVEGTARSVGRRFEYDHAGRLINTWHSVDDRDSILLVKNEYNELGQLIDKNLHGVNGVEFEQSIDYRYNIRGWLSSMNGAGLGQNSKNSDPEHQKRDLFGMDLLYNLIDNGVGNVAMFNGNISAMKWNNILRPPDTAQWAYKFDYDAMNRLAGADSKVYSGQWRDASAFHESGVTYDLNGNIKTLLRTDEDGTLMDYLKYDYGLHDTRSNRLRSVTDTGTSAGFSDSVATTDDYTYDANGNMTGDINKEITSITYNHLNLPETVTKSSGDHITYTYDATGRKVSQDVYDTTNVLVKRSDYDGDWFYENDTLKFVNHEEGRVIMTGLEPEYQYHLKDHLGNVRVTFTTKDKMDQALATFENVSEPAEESQFVYYSEAVKVNSPLFDHTNEANGAGNQTIFNNNFSVNTAHCQSHGTVRVSVVNGRLHASGASPNNLVYVAVPTETGKTYRVSCDVDLAGGVKLRTYAQDQSSMPFKSLSTTTIAADQRVTYTFLAYAATTYVIFEHYLSGIRDFYLDNLLIEKMSLGGSYSQRLNGSGNERIGLAKSIRVMPGDTVTAVVFAKYLDPDPDHWTASVKTIVDLIAGNMAPPLTLVDGGLPGSTGGMVFPMSDVIDKNGENGAAPRAYLNWLFFDRRMRLKDFGFERVSETAREYGQDTMHQRLEVSVPIKEAGYVYLYLSNDTHALGGPMIEVYFDDFEVKHTKSRLVQCQDYYPFGLVFNGYGREGVHANKWRFQGQEHIDDLGLNWDSFKWRNHQPEIGRFFNIDPLADKYVYNSPYAFSENQVIAHRELEGLEKTSVNHNGLEAEFDRATSNTTTLDRSGATIKVYSQDANGKVMSTTTLNLPSSNKQTQISDKSAKTIGEVAMSVSDPQITISSLKRDANDQGRAMMQNLIGTGKGQGLAAQRALYRGKPGEQVIDTFIKYRALQGIASTFGGRVTDSQIQGQLVYKITQLGVQNVTNHASPDPNLNVIDVSPKSIENSSGFVGAAQNHPAIDKFIPFPKDPGNHFEIRN